MLEKQIYHAYNEAELESLYICNGQALSKAQQTQETTTAANATAAALFLAM